MRQTIQSDRTTIEARLGTNQPDIADVWLVRSLRCLVQWFSVLNDLNVTITALARRARAGRRPTRKGRE